MLGSIQEDFFSTKNILASFLLGRKDGPFWEDLIRAYIVQKELDDNRNLDVTLSDIEKAKQDFFDERSSKFKSAEDWIEKHDSTELSLHVQISYNHKLNKLKELISEQDNLSEYFIKNKKYLDRVVFSRIVLKEQTLAEEIYEKILEEDIDFYCAVQKYSINSAQRFKEIMMKPVSFGRLPRSLRVMINSSSPGDILEPFRTQKGWFICKFEQYLESSLDHEVRDILQQEIFEIWIQEKRNEMVKNQDFKRWLTDFSEMVATEMGQELNA
ncbi:MAG: peptidylprolyl isomerase [Leptolyngbyaceae cyanobacterium]